MVAYGIAKARAMANRTDWNERTEITKAVITWFDADYEYELEIENEDFSVMGAYCTRISIYFSIIHDASAFFNPSGEFSAGFLRWEQKYAILNLYVQKE